MGQAPHPQEVRLRAWGLSVRCASLAWVPLLSTHEIRLPSIPFSLYLPMLLTKCGVLYTINQKACPLVSCGVFLIAETEVKAAKKNRKWKHEYMT